MTGSTRGTPRVMVAVAAALALALSGCGSSSRATGSATQHATTLRSGGASTADATGSASALLPANDPLLAGGRLESFRLTGVRSHYTGEVDVWTPPGYRAGSGQRYPVLLALHGWPGWPRMLYRNLELLHTVAQQVHAHDMAWPVVVMPQWGTVDTECTDADARHLSETWLTGDVAEWVRAHYDVRTDRDGWATYGYSAGAYCSSMLAMRHPGEFGAAVSMSGYSQPSFEKPYVPFSSDSALAHRYDLAAIARSDAPDVNLYEVSDRADRESYPSLSRLLQAAHAPTRLTTVLGTGGHAVSLWIPENGAALAWLGRTLPGFRAG